MIELYKAFICGDGLLYEQNLVSELKKKQFFAN